MGTRPNGRKRKRKGEIKEALAHVHSAGDFVQSIYIQCTGGESAPIRIGNGTSGFQNDTIKKRCRVSMSISADLKGTMSR